jgi:hypothetical protein
MCAAFGLICAISAALWAFFGVPWDWPGIRFGLTFGLVVGGPNLLYDVHNRRWRRPGT